MPTRKSTKSPAVPTTEAKDAPVATLQVTSCNVYLIKNPEGKIKALARVILNEQLLMSELRIVDGCQGLFVSYPNISSKNEDSYQSLYYPLTRSLRESIQNVILAKYEETIKDL